MVSGQLHQEIRHLVDLIWSFAKHHHQVSAAETIVFVFFNKRLNSPIIMQQQCELSKNENEHILFTDTLRETLQDVHVVFPHATGGSCIRMRE